MATLTWPELSRGELLDQREDEDLVHEGLDDLN